MNPIKIVKHDKFYVVRDDLITGGSKVRPLIKVLSGIPNEEIVYAADPYGYGPLALAEATKLTNKKLTLFYPNYSEMPAPMLLSIKQPHVSYCKCANYEHQKELEQSVKKYCEGRGAYFIPIGFDFQQYRDALLDVIRKVDFDPFEVWVAAGSGCLARMVQNAWPKAKINAVVLGFEHVRLESGIVKHNAIEKVGQAADIPPPYPSASHYDAKLWRFVQKLASEGALIWNVAG